MASTPRKFNVGKFFCSLMTVVVVGFVVRAVSVSCGDHRQFGLSDVPGPWLFWSAFFGVVVGIVMGAWPQPDSATKAKDEEAKKEEAKKAGKVTADPTSWGWQRVLIVWSAIGAGAVFGGGAAVRTYLMMRGRMDMVSLFDSCGLWLPLLLFSLGAGLTIGLLILTWWLVAQAGFSWTLGFPVLGLVFFGLFVWPTPYRYTEIKTEQIRPDGKDVFRVVLKINRLTGRGESIYPKESSQQP